jgi:hypothetical protein
VVEAGLSAKIVGSPVRSYAIFGSSREGSGGAYLSPAMNNLQGLCWKCSVRPNDE